MDGRTFFWSTAVRLSIQRRPPLPGTGSIGTIETGHSQIRPLRRVLLYRVSVWGPARPTTTTTDGLTSTSPASDPTNCTETTGPVVSLTSPPSPAPAAPDSGVRVARLPTSITMGTWISL